MEKTNNNILATNTVLKGEYEVKSYMGTDGLMNLYHGEELETKKKIKIYESFPWYMVSRGKDGVTVVPEQFLETMYPEVIERGKKNVEYMKYFQEENIVFEIKDYFEENNTYYIIAEDMEVISLKELLEEEKETYFSLEETMEMLDPIMNFLEKLHQKQLIHREITPGNIYINKNTNKAFLANFYTVRDFSNTDATVYITAGYTPLEQHSKHDKQGPWTDVYSLCAVIYECVTGQKMQNVVDRLVEESTLTISPSITNISESQKEILLQGLAIKPEDRISSVRELIEKLMRIKTMHMM